MKKTVKIVCNLTGYSQGLQREYYEKKIAQYGSEELLQRYYIQNKIITLLKKGYNLSDIAKLMGFELKEEKKEYYDELVAFHNKNSNTGLISPVTPPKNTNTTFVKTASAVSEFIGRWKAYNNQISEQG